MKTWKRMREQPTLGVIADEYLYFTAWHDDDPVGVLFRLPLQREGITTDVVDGHRYRLTLYIEEEVEE
jgi:hypothetical protein